MAYLSIKFNFDSCWLKNPTTAQCWSFEFTKLSSFKERRLLLSNLVFYYEVICFRNFSFCRNRISKLMVICSSRIYKMIPLNSNIRNQSEEKMSNSSTCYYLHTSIKKIIAHNAWQALSIYRMRMHQVICPYLPYHLLEGFLQHLHFKLKLFRFCKCLNSLTFLHFVR